MRYFEDAIKWVESENRYIPDVYHTILHVLILSALVTTLIYCVKSKHKK